MITLIVGVITIVGLLVTRMPSGDRAILPLPAEITLPTGVQAAAVTQGGDWFAVVTTDQRILIFNRDGSLRQEVTVAAP